MMPQLRRRWACPDLGMPREAGFYNPIPGSSEEFPDCPGYYLRMAGQDMPAAHLIDGMTHPATVVSQRAAELEAGALMADSLPPKVLELVHVHMREKSAAREFESERRKAK